MIRVKTMLADIELIRLDRVVRKVITQNVSLLTKLGQ